MGARDTRVLQLVQPLGRLDFTFQGAVMACVTQHVIYPHIHGLGFSDGLVLLSPNILVLVIVQSRMRKNVQLLLPKLVALD